MGRHACFLAVCISSAWTVSASSQDGVLTLDSGWSMQSSVECGGLDGKAISSPGLDTSRWYTLSKFPATVLAGLQQSGEYPDLFYAQNLKLVNASRFDVSWWYRVEKTIDELGTDNMVTLRFKGINYRANVWLNGKLLASKDSIVGTYRYFDLNISSVVNADGYGSNESRVLVLGVEVFRPYNTGLDKETDCRGKSPKDCVDLAMSWVDWAPTPADVNMGIWREVELIFSRQIRLQYPQVTTSLTTMDSLGGVLAEVSVLVELANMMSSVANGMLHAELRDPSGKILVNVNKELTIKPNDVLQYTLNVTQFPELALENPPLWWPWQMGQPNLCTLTMSFVIGGRNSSTLHLLTGLREVSKEIDKNNNALFSINKKRILIRGGGWSPDLLQRMSRERYESEFTYVRDLGLNAVRLEGKLQADDLFEVADEKGILVLPGICCCDAWQAWDLWGPEQYNVSRESLRSQLKRMRIHPSASIFLYSSDELPPPKVESNYLQVFDEEKWFNPTVSSASYMNSTLTGISGVKMTGPYGWVPPNFWLDPRGMSNEYGSAFGFITETSPGGAPLVYSSIEKIIPQDSRWGPDGPTDDWQFHCGSPFGAFRSLVHFTPGLESRLGNASSAKEYSFKAQIEAYESHRAMFEGYSRNKYNSTGIIQWMLNNAWPSMIWHLYDYNLAPGGSYFGAKKALEPLHIMYSYSDHSLWVINSLYTGTQDLQAFWTVYNLQGKILLDGNISVPGLGSDETRKIAAPIDTWPVSGSKGTVLLDLVLRESTTNSFKLTSDSEKIVSRNLYYLPERPDSFPMGGCYLGCPNTTFANMTDLAFMEPGRVTVTWEGHKEFNVTACNKGDTIIFFLYFRAVDENGNDVLPILWSDNYITLFKSECRMVTMQQPEGSSNTVVKDIVVEAYNHIEVNMETY
eukprot:m.84645 g.84645  ORF g.84645 m.84645 type:complete len:915 (-) comp12975_c0_seq2:25-2769(-)